MMPVYDRPWVCECARPKKSRLAGFAAVQCGRCKRAILSPLRTVK